MTSEEPLLNACLQRPSRQPTQLAFISWPLAVEQAFGVTSGFFLDPGTRRHLPKIFAREIWISILGIGSYINTPPPRPAQADISNPGAILQRGIA